MELIGIFSSTLVKWYRNIRLSCINKDMMWSYLSNSSACFQLCSSPIRNSILRYVNCFKALWKIDRIDFFIKHEFISNMYIISWRAHCLIQVVAFVVKVIFVLFNICFSYGTVAGAGSPWLQREYYWRWTAQEAG